MIESTRHVHVLGALGRLAANGGWARIMAGKPLESADDLADAEVLLAAGVVGEGPVRGAGTYVPTDLHPHYDNPAVLASAIEHELRQALRQLAGDSDSSDAPDTHEIRTGAAISLSAARALVDGVIPHLPGVLEAMRATNARFLDVGVGAGAVSIEVCRAFPECRALGIDVRPEALDLAREQALAARVQDRLQLRRRSVVDLDHVEEFCLAWLPQVFIQRVDLERGLSAVSTALRARGWLVMPVAAVSHGATPLDRAAVARDSTHKGGGLMEDSDVRALLSAAGFAEPHVLGGVDQAIYLAQRVTR